MTSSDFVSSSSKTYYEILQVSPTASPLDIKKAYRRLALQYHPDRNSDPNAKELFQQVGHAYSCLSDPIQRREYDQQLQQDHQQQHVPVDSRSPTSSPPTFTTFHSSSRPHYYYNSFHSRSDRAGTPVMTDPWSQFDFLFHNDPFFRDYFENPEKVQQELDAWQHSATTTTPTTATGSTPNHNNRTNTHRTTNSKKSSSPASNRMQQEGWIPWLLRQCGIQFTMTTIVQDGNGRIHAKQISSTPSRTNPHPYKYHYNDSCQQQQPSARHRVSPWSSSTSSSSSSLPPTSTPTTIQQETVSYMENGQRVWIKKRQIQGTFMEDKIVGTTLVERKINGVSVPLQQEQERYQ